MLLDQDLEDLGILLRVQGIEIDIDLVLETLLVLEYLPDRRRYGRSHRSSHDSKSKVDKCIGCKKVGHFVSNCAHIGCYCCNGQCCQPKSQKSGDDQRRRSDGGLGGRRRSVRKFTVAENEI